MKLINESKKSLKLKLCLTLHLENYIKIKIIPR